MMGKGIRIGMEGPNHNVSKNSTTDAFFKGRFWLGSDHTVYDLIGKLPVNSQDERLFMVKSIRFVKDAFVSQGSGMRDSYQEFWDLKPDYFIVNSDGNTEAKAPSWFGAAVDNHVEDK